MNMLTCIEVIPIDKYFKLEANEVIRAKEREGWFLFETPVILKEDFAMLVFKRPEREEELINE